MIDYAARWAVQQRLVISVKMSKTKNRQTNWQAYQSRLQRAALRRRLRKRLVLAIPLIVVTGVLVYGVFAGIQGLADWRRQSDPAGQVSTPGNSSPEDPYFDKTEIQSILDSRDWVDLANECFDITRDGHHFRVDTSIDPELQQFMRDKMDRDYARYIGIVVLEPETGRVLSMIGYDRTDQAHNPCIDACFPAASIFKIVTAAAGIEKCGFKPSSRFAFNGGKYTLYKYQLRDRTNKYTNWTSLKDSFAQSINPVFGKIGANYLGRVPLETYADAFGFNRFIHFELPLSPSHVALSDDSYQWAEVACGFNRETTLSPLHGALMSAAIINSGRFIEPTIVDSITDETGTVRYRSRPKVIGRALSEEASAIINRLMIATVKSGTSRKAFRGARRDRVLSRLQIGGKTGSISSREIQHLRYDWFVGFAAEKKGDAKLAVAAVVAHEKFIGKRAAHYAKIAMRHYFGEYFDRVEAAKAEDQKKQSQEKDDNSLSMNDREKERPHARV